MLAALRDLGHRGLVSVEIQGGALDAPEVARRSLEFLRAADGRTASDDRHARHVLHLTGG